MFSMSLNMFYTDYVGLEIPVDVKINRNCNTRIVPIDGPSLRIETCEEWLGHSNVHNSGSIHPFSTIDTSNKR